MEQNSSPTVAPINNTKQNSGVKIVTAIVSILAIVGIAGAIYFFIDGNNKSAENANLRAKVALLQTETGTELVEKEENGTTITIVENTEDPDKKIKDLVREVANALGKKFNYNNFFTVFGDGSRILLQESGISTKSEKSYGVVSSSDISNQEIRNEIMLNAYSVVEPILISKGFSLEQEEPSMFKNALFYNSNDMIYCDLSDGSLPFTFSCSNENWISKTHKELVVDLVKASGINYINANVSDIKDSEVKPYQTLTGGSSNFAVLFYRTSPESEWQYFTGTQAEIECDKYDTPDLKNAFAGSMCWDQTTGQQSTVRP